MLATGAALVPPWLEPLLTAPFFSTCHSHDSSPRSERNMFCLDCPSSSALCFYCRSSAHSQHRTIQIRRSSYHDVVRVAEIEKVLDISGVQTYVINSARVLFLNERPQPKGGLGATSSGGAPAVGKIGGIVAAGGGVHRTCETCSRTLLDLFRFCSLGCKLEGIKRNGNACFVVDEDEEEEEQPSSEKKTKGVEKTKRWRRRARGIGIRGGSGGGGGGGGGGETSHGSDGQGMCTPPLTSTSHSILPTSVNNNNNNNTRRRKGIPHRSPLASS